MDLFKYIMSSIVIIYSCASSERINYLEVFNLRNARNVDLIVCGEKNFEMEQKEISEDYGLFASFSTVRRCTEIDRKNWTSLHDKNRIAIMLLPSNITSFINVVNYVSNIHGNDTYKWKPFWFFVFPNYISSPEESIQHERHLMKMESTLNKCQMNSQVFVFFFLRPTVSDNINDKVVIFEIYGVKNVTMIDKYYPVEPRLLFDIMNNKAKRRNFHEVEISGVAVDDPQTKLMTEFEDVNGEVRFKSGFAVEAFNYVSESLNFTRKAMRATDQFTQLTNGSVSGLGLIIANRLADILVVNSELLEYRIKELTFLPSFYSAKLNAFFIQPPASNFRNIYLQPFKLDLWITIIISWLVIVTCMIFFSFIKGKLDILVIEEIEDHQLARDSLLWAVSAITQKGWYMYPKAFSFKIVFVTGLFTACLVYTSYAAVIISTLSIVRDPIQNMVDLAHSDIQIFADNLLETSFNVVQTIAKNRSYYGYSHPLKIEVAKAVSELNSSMAVVTTEDLFYYPAKKLYSDRYICQKISKITVPGPNIQGGMYIRARSPFREHFKHRFLVFRESGVSKRNNLDFRRKSGLSCTTSSDPMTHEALGISDVVSAFFLLAFAFISSWLALNFEKIYSWIKIKRNLLLTAID